MSLSLWRWWSDVVLPFCAVSGSLLATPRRGPLLFFLRGGVGTRSEKSSSGLLFDLLGFFGGTSVGKASVSSAETRTLSRFAEGPASDRRDSAIDSSHEQNETFRPATFLSPSAASCLLAASPFRSLLLNSSITGSSIFGTCSCGSSFSNMSDKAASSSVRLGVMELTLLSSAASSLRILNRVE